MTYDVLVREVAPEHLASVRGMYRIAELPQAVPRELDRIKAVLRAEGMEPAGGVVTIYYGPGKDMVDVEMGVIIRGVFFPQDPKAGVGPSMLPGGRVAFTVHTGPYRDISAAYEAIGQYAAANGLELADVVWEKYPGPDLGLDLSCPVTEVYWLLAHGEAAL